MTSKPQSPHGAPKRRNRVPLSCESCRSRKLKCDRQKPCQNCTARGLQNTCIFAGTVSAKIRHGGHGPQSEDMRSRLQRLEALVTTMAQTSAPPASMQTPESSPDNKFNALSPESSDLRPPASLDTRRASLVKNATGQHFIGASHWEAVLQDLAIIKDHFEEQHEPQYSSIPDSRNPALLSGISCELSQAELMETLPSKDFSDRLISRFFDTYDPAVPSRQLLHKPTFMKDYAAFWADLDKVSLTSLGKMFSVYCLALQTYDRQDDEPLDLRGTTLDLSEMFRKRAAQCLLKSNIMTPTRAHLESFLLYGISEYARVGDEAVVAQWFILGMMVRKAFHMGYHRDPDDFPNLTPFEKEMRRRLWAHVWQIDTLYSFSLGLPSAVSKSKSNVASPRNLFEEELFEEMTELPQSRPTEVMTPISFTIAKLHILRGLGAVVEHMNSLEEHTYGQVVEMNQQLAEALESVPQFLRIKSWEESATDPKPLRLQRLQIRMFYDKATCMVNRRFVNAPVEHCGDLPRPRDLCIESALSLLHLQVGFHRERNKWYRFHLSRHDFLLAAVILFLVLGNKRQVRFVQTRREADANNYDKEDLRLIRALHQSREIWAEHTSASNDAQTACRMFDKMKDRFQLPSADINMGMPLNTPSTQPLPDINMMTAKPEPHLGMITPGHEPIVPVAGQYTDFDWSGWEAAFENSSMNEELGDLSAFWPSGIPSGA